ncbi:MAG: hypothetical protein KA257_08200 [Opitutaceae bacterium]|jgi:SAM-dependent methyltransferase|nr:hypothetical protein [Opitutaceae bacterium]MBP9913681.1 hypothetical protein [Opitutaceae bacterium]
MIEFIRNKAKIFWAQTRGEIEPDRARLQPEAIQFHPSSYADPHGRVFRRDGRLYRGVAAEKAVFCIQLFETGVVDALVVKRLLVPTVRSPLKVEGYALVLEHTQVPFVSYPFEWPGELLRAAALHTLALLQELALHGLTLKDAHGWNVLFDGTRPVFVDFGSIVEVPAGHVWHAQVEQQFREYFLHPLEMMAAGRGRMARALLRDFEQGIGAEDCQTMLGLSGQPRGETGQSLPFSWYHDRIAALDLRPAATAWSGYYDGAFPPLLPDASWTLKHHAVQRLLQQYQPATVLDIGANRGWYALLAAKEGARVVAFDNDEVCINQLFRDASEGRLDVQPLVMSYVNPSPRYGIGHGVMESAAERLQCDLVLGLALVHHMVFKMHLNFEQIAAGLAAYTKRTLIVEFPPAEDFHVSQWMSDRYSWYNLENFQAALRVHFPKINAVDSDPVPRVLLVCER